jgi:hypothetical protein
MPSIIGRGAPGEQKEGKEDKNSGRHHRLWTARSSLVMVVVVVGPLALAPLLRFVIS